MKRLPDYIERDEFRILLLCIRQYFALFEEVAGVRRSRKRNGRLDAEGLRASLPALEALGVRDMEKPYVWTEAIAKIGKADGFELFARWLVEEGHLELLDDCERHEVTELDGEHLRWAWESRG